MRKKGIDFSGLLIYNNNARTKGKEEKIWLENNWLKKLPLLLKHFDEVGLETFRIAIKSEQCFDSDIEDFIKSWEEGDGWSASTFLTTASTY